jgi:polar amino acid transport system substrate-binding protein
MRFLARLLSVVIPLTLLIGGAANAREWKAIQESGTIKAATEGAFQPFNYYEGSTLTGFEVELAEVIAKKLGLKLEWSVVPFDAQIAALKQDRFDFAIASHGFTEERAKSVDFANPHYCTGGQIAAHKGGPLTVAALNGKSVGVQLATTYAGAAQKIKGIKAIKTYKGDPELSRRCAQRRSMPGSPTSSPSRARSTRIPTRVSSAASWSSSRRFR